MDKELLKIFIEYKKKRDIHDKEYLSNYLKEIKDKYIKNYKLYLDNFQKNLKERGIDVYFLEKENNLASILDKLISSNDYIVKSKTNVFKELSVENYLNKKNIEFFETDLGDFLMSLSPKKEVHPVLPSLHLKKKEIVDLIYKKYNVRLDPNVNEIVSFAKKIIAEKINRASIGISGANVASQNGEIVILENEGNISKITRIPDHHIIFLGIEKIVENIEDAMHVVKCSAVWGTGQDWPSYVNIISGPSKTADIENELVIGAQGAKKVSVILVDNGRIEMLNKYPDLWRCINCGSCLNFCPAYYQDLEKFGDKYLGAKGILWTAFNQSLEKSKNSGLYKCTTCEACVKNCPAQIDLVKYIRKLRKEIIQAGFETTANQEMIKHVKEAGNPFGKIEDGKIPNKLYCC